MARQHMNESSSSSRNGNLFGIFMFLTIRILAIWTERLTRDPRETVSIPRLLIFTLLAICPSTRHFWFLKACFAHHSLVPTSVALIITGLIEAMAHLFFTVGARFHVPRQICFRIPLMILFVQLCTRETLECFALPTISLPCSATITTSTTCVTGFSLCLLIFL